MALVQMKCPNCGGQMTLKDNQFCCPHCKTMVLNIVDAKIDADISVITPDEFAKKIAESKRQFVVNINDNLEVFDVETEVINKRIADATQMLEEGKFDAVIKHLSSVKRDVLSVERLRYLASYQVKNEYELSSHDGYVNGANYAKLLTLCDAQTKTTYQKIETYCRTNFDQRNIIKEEASKVYDLIAVELYDKALVYAKKILTQYPNSAVAWSYLLAAKYHKDGNYDNVEHEYKMAQLCPDFYIMSDNIRIQYYLSSLVNYKISDLILEHDAEISEFLKKPCNASLPEDGLSFEYHCYDEICAVKQKRKQKLLNQYSWSLDSANRRRTIFNFIAMGLCVFFGGLIIFWEASDVSRIIFDLSYPLFALLSLFLLCIIIAGIANLVEWTKTRKYKPKDQIKLRKEDKKSCMGYKKSKVLLLSLIVFIGLLCFLIFKCLQLSWRI